MPTHRNNTMSNRTYDALKHIALIVLPALATLYTTVGPIWGLPFVHEVVATIVAVDTFLGVILKINSSRYNNSDAAYDGTIHEDGTTAVPLFEFNEPIENLVTKDNIRMKVNNTANKEVISDSAIVIDSAK